MHFFHELDDFEPLDADERCDQAYGLYHIGREDERRDEIALFFDGRWLPDPYFLKRGLWSIVNRHNGRLMAFSEYKSAEHSDEQLQRLLCENVYCMRSFDVGSDEALTVVIVELVKPAVWSVDNALRAYTSYIGYADISWPSGLRSVITARQEYI